MAAVIRNDAALGHASAQYIVEESTHWTFAYLQNEDRLRRSARWFMSDPHLLAKIAEPFNLYRLSSMQDACHYCEGIRLDVTQHSRPENIVYFATRPTNPPCHSLSPYADVHLTDPHLLERSEMLSTDEYIARTYMQSEFVHCWMEIFIVPLCEELGMPALGDSERLPRLVRL